MNKLTCALICSTLHLMAAPVNAQKLPNVQTESLRAPANIKIDGKATEWNAFRAYNKSVEVFYTLSNDNDNLYLVVQATKPRVIEKIISVGITFIVNTAGKKKDNEPDNISITFPLVDVASGQSILRNAGAKAKSDVPVLVRTEGPPNAYDEPIPTSSDSLNLIANKSLAATAKVIKIKGIKEIADGEISVYNEEKIKIAEAFDKNAAYNYELAIPLKYLGLNINSQMPFAYGIKLESRLTSPKKGLITRYVYANHQAINVDQDLDATTDFWGEYTLAK